MSVQRREDREGFGQIDAEITQVLSKESERTLLKDLAKCRMELSEALKSVESQTAEKLESKFDLSQLLTNGQLLPGLKNAQLGALLIAIVSFDQNWYLPTSDSLPMLPSNFEIVEFLTQT